MGFIGEDECVGRPLSLGEELPCGVFEGGGVHPLLKGAQISAIGFESESVFASEEGSDQACDIDGEVRCLCGEEEFVHKTEPTPEKKKGQKFDGVFKAG
jgi:hypothetical protein